MSDLFSPDSVLAIDAGQSGIKVRHKTSDDIAEWNLPGIRTDLPLLPQLVEVLRGAGARGFRAAAIGFGVSGLTDENSDAAPLLDAAAEAGIGATRVLLAHDSITAYLGALDDSRGAVVAAGTGVVTLAVGAHEVARVDGWGYLMGDAGSGFWIGRAALEAAMRDHDGRGDPTKLTDIVRGDFPDLENAYIELQSDEARVSRIAAYARAVADLADEDAVAGGIVDRAASELALSVVTALRRVGEDTAPQPEVCAVGGVFRSARLAARFSGAVHEAIPAAQIVAGTNDPLDGAARLAALRESNPLYAYVAHAER